MTGGEKKGKAKQQTTDADQTVITLGNLRQELEKLHDPLIVTRLEALENRSRDGEGAVGAGADDIREWLVVERLKFEDDEDLKFKISTLFEEMGVGDVSIKQVFRMGKSDNPRYIPVVKGAAWRGKGGPGCGQERPQVETFEAWGVCEGISPKVGQIF